MSWNVNFIRRLFREHSRIERPSGLRSRLQIEALEDRCVPASFYWVATAPGNWTDGNNWKSEGGDAAPPGEIPGPDDSVFIRGDKSTFDVIIDGEPVAVKNLAITEKYIGTLRVRASAHLRQSR